MGVILGILGLVALPLFIRLLGVEIGVWHKPLCERLVKIAAARLPEAERASAESEWLAVIQDLRSPTMQFVHAASYVWSSLHIRRAIANETSTPSSKAMLTAIGTQLLCATGVLLLYWFAEPEIVTHVAKPTTLMILSVFFLVATYLSYRFFIWKFSREAQHR